MAKRKTHHVVKSPDGGWDVKKGGSLRKSGNFRTKKEAENFGRQVSRNQKSELIVHGKDGKIQRTDSHGNDPMPPRDKN